MVIDGDGHCNEPRDLFDRYLEKEFRERGPKVVNAHGMRWMIEGKFLPRPVGTWGHGTSSGYFGTNMAKKGMATTTQSLDDVSGRLKDLDTEGIDIQVVYPILQRWRPISMTETSRLQCVAPTTTTSPNSLEVLMDASGRSLRWHFKIPWRQRRKFGAL